MILQAGPPVYRYIRSCEPSDVGICSWFSDRGLSGLEGRSFQDGLRSAFPENRVAVSRPEVSTRAESLRSCARCCFGVLSIHGPACTVFGPLCLACPTVPRNALPVALDSSSRALGDWHVAPFESSHTLSCSQFLNCGLSKRHGGVFSTGPAIRISDCSVRTRRMLAGSTVELDGLQVSTDTPF